MLAESVAGLVDLGHGPARHPLDRPLGHRLVQGRVQRLAGGRERLDPQARERVDQFGAHQAHALDNLDRALDAADQDDPLLAGRTSGALGTDRRARSRGDRVVLAAGEPFDPSLHEAMAQQPARAPASGTVVEVYQPGYRLGEHVIRPARVVVAA